MSVTLVFKKVRLYIILRECKQSRDDGNNPCPSKSIPKEL